MGRGTSTLILLVVALALGGYLYFVDSERPLESEDARAKVFSYEASAITQVEVRSSSGEGTTLRRTGDNEWNIVQPVEAPADGMQATQLVTSLATLEEERVVEENAADLAAFGLAEPRIEVSFTVADENTPRRLQLGDSTPTGSGIYARLPESTRVFLVSSTLNTTFDKSTFDFRDKTALRFEEEKVTALEITSGDGRIRLERTGEAWTLVQPVEAPADFVSVNGVLGQLQSAQMTALRDRPEEIKDLRQYGLDPPRAVATLAAGDATVALQIGGESEDGGVWARDPAKPAVFSLASGVAAELTKSAADFRRKDVFEFRPFSTTRFEIARGSEVMAFERVKGTGENAVDTWKQVAPAERTVDASNFEGALLEFANLRAESFTERAGTATGHDAPAAVITVRFDDGKQEERVTIGRAGGAVYAVRADQPGAMRVEAGRYEAALQKLDAIK